MLIQAGRRPGELRVGLNLEMKASTTKSLPYVFNLLSLPFPDDLVPVHYQEEFRPEPVRCLFPWI